MSRVSVKIREIPVPATSNPEIVVYFDGTGASSLGSSVSWENEATMCGFRTMFAVKPEEVIDSVTINAQGIQATFKRRK